MGFDKYIVEQFDDVKILRYEVKDFENLCLKEKLFVYYLSQAALAGRDILWDQNNKYNLRIRQLLEKIILEYKGERNNEEFESFLLYAKKVFFANGIHHHYSMDKFIPKFSCEYFRQLAQAVGENSEEIEKVIFDPEYMKKRVVLDEGKDLIQESANNFYQNVTQQEVEDYYKNMTKEEECPVSVGLNSTLVKENDFLVEKVWKIGGKYDKEIRKIVSCLRKALPYACNLEQEKIIELLIEYYQTGDLKIFDIYSIKWVKEEKAGIDFINGFIEVYGDPLAYKATWESVVQIIDKEAGKRTQKLAEHALWFEKNAPIDEAFKKTEVKGITARVVQAAMLGGDCHPATPIGINLPNAEWIREKYGSKSVTLDNITYAYHMASLDSGVTNEFAFTEEEKERAKKYGYAGGNVHTDLHECLGHGSGKLKEGVTTADLRNYYSTIEETRADLFALYYVMDSKLIELGIIENEEVGRCEYDSYIRNGLIVQLTRIKAGDNIEESHMRNRQLISAWVYEKGKEKNIIEKIEENNKTYFVINDYIGLRELFGELLRKVQRIKSEGDFEGAKNLIEGYGVKVDTKLHTEVLERYNKLNVPPYAGFLNPTYHLIEEDGEVKDVTISYGDSFLEQMLEYGNISKEEKFC